MWQDMKTCLFICIVTSSFWLVYWRRLVPQTSLLLFTSPLLHQVLVVKARRIYWRVVTSSGYLGSQQRASFRVMDRRMLLYPLIFVLCWGPGLFLHPNPAQEVSDVMKGLFVSETVSVLFPQRWVWLFFGWWSPQQLRARPGSLSTYHRSVLSLHLFFTLCRPVKTRSVVSTNLRCLQGVTFCFTLWWLD